MQRIFVRTSVFVAVLALGAFAAQQVFEWEVHDMARPRPPVVTPGAENHLPPSDAIVLFDGTDLSAWQSSRDGSDAPWRIEDDAMRVVRGSGDIQTRQAFGSCQLHIEWASPENVRNSGQRRGNSGVFLMGHYEIQILDSYNNDTYPDGQAASVYAQKPPIVNASRGPGQWQTYDIIFHAPVFKDGKLEKPATVTVLHNGVLVQDHWVIQGRTRHQQRPAYEPHPEKLPLRLQDHNDPGDQVRFRNIWIRPLDD